MMGKEGLVEMNNNGEKFVDFCATHNLVIGGSVFKHKWIHKASWIYPNHINVNQIDHIAYSKGFRRNVQDVIVRREADVGSDHYRVLAFVKVKLKLKKNFTGCVNRRLCF